MPQKAATGQHYLSSPLGSAAFVNDLVDVTEAYKSGQLGSGPGQSNGLSDPVIKIKNLTGANLAIGEAVYLGDYLFDKIDKRAAWLEGNMISTTFSPAFAFAAEPIPMDKIGLAYARGIALASYTPGTTPVKGEGWGPKPGSKKIFKGFPGCRILDVGTVNNVALVALEPITQLLGKTTGAITAGSTSAWKIYTGTLGSETDSGFTAPTAWTRIAIDSGKWIKATWINNGWHLEPLECNAA